PVRHALRTRNARNEGPDADDPLSGDDGRPRPPVDEVDGGLPGCAPPNPREQAGEPRPPAEAVRDLPARHGGPHRRGIAEAGMNQPRRDREAQGQQRTQARQHEPDHERRLAEDQHRRDTDEQRRSRPAYRIEAGDTQVDHPAVATGPPATGSLATYVNAGGTLRHATGSARTWANVSPSTARNRRAPAIAVACA